VNSHRLGRPAQSRVDLDAVNRQRLPIMLGLGIAAVFSPTTARWTSCSARASGKWCWNVHGRSIKHRFASVLVVVGVVAARVGRPC